MNIVERDKYVAALSKEVALLCAKDGVVLWADDHALKQLGVTGGTRLGSVATPGTEGKVHLLVGDASTRDVVRVELSLLTHDLKADPDTRSIPFIIQTAKSLDEAERTKLERETSAILKKQSLSREVAITRIREALEAAGVKTEQTRAV